MLRSGNEVTRLSLSLSLSILNKMCCVLTVRARAELYSGPRTACTGCACQGMMTRTSDSPPPHKSRSINQPYSPVHFPDHSLRDASIVNELMKTMQLPLNDDDDDDNDDDNNNDNNDKNSSLESLSVNTFLPNLKVCRLLSKYYCLTFIAACSCSYCTQIFCGKGTYEGWNFNSGNYLFTTDTK